MLFGLMYNTSWSLCSGYGGSKERQGFANKVKKIAESIGSPRFQSENYCCLMVKVTQMCAFTQEIFNIGLEAFNVTSIGVRMACAGCVQANPNFLKFGFCASFINFVSLSRV
jgi:hypothetical protein